MSFLNYLLLIITLGLLMACIAAKHVPSMSIAVTTNRYKYWKEDHNGVRILYIYCLTESDCQDALRAAGWDKIAHTQQDLKFKIVESLVSHEVK